MIQAHSPNCIDEPWQQYLHSNKVHTYKSQAQAWEISERDESYPYGTNISVDVTEKGASGRLPRDNKIQDCQAESPSILRRVTVVLSLEIVLPCPGCRVQRVSDRAISFPPSRRSSTALPNHAYHSLLVVWRIAATLECQQFSQ